MIEYQTENLQSKCLHCITLNYDKFHLAFNSSAYEHLRSSIKGIRKKHLFCDSLKKKLSSQIEMMYIYTLNHLLRKSDIFKIKEENFPN